MLYVGTNQPQERRPWDKELPAFNNKLVRPRRAAKLRLGKPNVYDVGAHTGCGCGLLEVDDDDEGARGQSRSALHAFLATATETGDAEVLACWAGDEGKDAERRTIVAEETEQLPLSDTWDRPIRLTVRRG